MNTQHTLSSIQSDFALWRQNKTSPRDRTPKVLKERTVALLNDYSPGKITNTLGISREMLKRWQAQFEIAPTDDAIEFISLPRESKTSSCEKAAGITLNLTQPNGNQWSLQGELTSSQLSTFVSALATA